MRSVRAKCTFIVVLKDAWLEVVLGPSGIQGPILCICYLVFILFLVFLDPQTPRSLGSYRDFLHCLERFGTDIFYVFAGVNIMTILCYSSLLKMLQNSFRWPWRLLGVLGESLGSLLFLVCLGIIFHRFWWPWRLLGLLWRISWWPPCRCESIMNSSFQAPCGHSK